ncbi:MAG: DJ-1/PfpI family protein [Lachnospiraceae bacterium]|nr:DJ-1/PfpI family protein [Lachnospiraceae bacterium]
MKDVFLVYDTCCFYEIVILTYFLNVSGCDVVFCSQDGKSVRTTEGFSVCADMSLKELDKEQIRSFVIPGGDISAIDNEDIRGYLRELGEREVLIGGICAGVDVLDHAGILQDVKSTHSADEDVVCDAAVTKGSRVVTARANAYVDFAIEAAKQLDIFADEEDLQETIDFWRYFKRAE